MDETLRILNLENERQRESLRSFLSRFSFTLDDVDFAVVLLDHGEIVASSCKRKNVLKFFAIDPAYQNQGLSQKLLTEVTYRMFEEGYDHSFVFTPLFNREIFRSLGYDDVAASDEVVLLEKGPETIGGYIRRLDETYDISGKQNGAIVMNGNPFTLGHQYLIETAAKSVQQLLIFVVEEEASSFPFKDRFRMFQEGTKHLKNVILIPSGRYIISQATFPNYFLRDLQNSFAIYATLDVTIFGKWFKKLNITKRFVGEEPLDPMTNQYNEAMKRILPYYGIELVVIPRVSNEQGIISASIVRRLLKEDKWDDVKKYVPTSTFEYLKNATEVINELKKHDRKH
ncbi:MAG: [citrate (pro-3S)-lyase] ligase [Erysipelotrichaceae bacterium]